MKYSDFVQKRDLENIITWSIPILESTGVNPSDFYQILIENPEREPQEILNELLGGVVDIAKGLAGGIKNVANGFGANSRKRQIEKDIEYINQKYPSQQQKDAAGFTKQVMDKMRADLAKEGGLAGGSNWSNFKQGYSDTYNQANQYRDTQDRENRLLNIQQRYGVKPFVQGIPVQNDGSWNPKQDANIQQNTAPQNQPSNTQQQNTAQPSPVQNNVSPEDISKQLLQNRRNIEGVWKAVKELQQKIGVNKQPTIQPQ